MIRKKSKDFYTINKDIILLKLKDYKYLTSQELMNFLTLLKEEGLVSSSLSFNNFFLKLIDDGLNQYSIKIRDVEKIRYTMQEKLSIYDYCNTLIKDSFFSMSTSLNIQGLSKYRNNFIFISKERTSRVEFDLKTLSQESIDNAFKKQARRTKALDQLNEYTIVLLETNYTNKYEIIDFNTYEISSVNRVFVEIISNIQYFQSPEVVIDLFKNIKENLDIEKIYNVIEKFDFVYPYYQLAGYYLEEIGYLKEELNKFYNKKAKLKFYTQKAKSYYHFNEYWNIYF